MPCTYIRTASSAKSSVKLARGRAALLGVVKLALQLVQRNLCSGLSGPATPSGAVDVLPFRFVSNDPHDGQRVRRFEPLTTSVSPRFEDVYPTSPL